MVRLARVVAIDVAHHITQRGNARRFILERDTERAVYLDLLQQGIERHGVELIGYCIMSNHVHLVAAPANKDSLARSLKQVHGRFASYWNARNRSRDHVWQGRYYSWPLDDQYLWEALRYVELNPLRASIATSPESWHWSSAAAHCGTAAPQCWLYLDRWHTCWTTTARQAYLKEPQLETSRKALGDCTFSGRPFGSAAFVAELEKQENRILTPARSWTQHANGDPNLPLLASL
jgi:putative transposase